MENKRSLTLAVVGLTTALAIGYIGYTCKDGIMFEIFAKPEAHKMMGKLNKIRLARLVIESDIRRISAMSDAARGLGKELDDVTRREIKQLSVDTDFLFESLDAISGEYEYVQTNRKAVVLELQRNASAIDELMTHWHLND